MVIEQLKFLLIAECYASRAPALLPEVISISKEAWKVLKINKIK